MRTGQVYVRLFFVIVMFVAIILAWPSFADVTVSGNVAFSSLDGSALDQDGAANGIFTVTNGHLAILGTVNANDDGQGNASARPMRFVVSGNMTIGPSGALYAENRRGGGNGGNITLDVGGNLVLQNGAIVSSAAESTDAGGNIALNAGGSTTIDAGSIVSAACTGGRAGAIAISSNGRIDVNGLVASGPGRTLSTGSVDVLTGGSAKQQGGAITVRSTTAISVGLSGVIASQGRNNGSGFVLLAACGVDVLGRVASIADRTGDTPEPRVRVLANDAIQIVGQSGSLYALSSSPGGSVDVVSIGGPVTMSRNIARTARFSLAAKGNVTADAVSVSAASTSLRSYAGGVSWTGAAPPVGTTVTYCTTLSGIFSSGTQTCTPASPPLPAGESLPSCSTTPVNRDPVAVNDSHVVAEGGMLNIAAPGVLANDSDPDGQPISAALVTGPVHASSFALDANGSFLYVHDGSETSTDGFTYRASDGAAASNVATVTIAVAAVNDAPVANADAFAVGEGGTLNGAVLDNDSDLDSATLTATLVTGPAHAASFALQANGTFTYVHDGSESSSDTFTYKANDGSADSNVVTVTITVTPVNDAPVANPDAYAVNEGGTVNGAVLANDTDPDSTLTAVLVTGPAHAASFVLNANGSFTCVHDGSETTSDSFTYKANDGSADSNIATVTITVTPVNDAPVVNPDAFAVNEGGTVNGAVLANDTDPDSTLTAVLVTGPAHAASFALQANGTFTYVHDGSETTSDSFTYKANDGSADSNVVTVTITVNPVNDAPVANPDSYAVDEGGTVNGGVLGNDTDPDSTLTAVLVSGPAHAASFALNTNGSFTYVHDGSETTNDAFTYKANDGSADSNIATVTITVNPVNDAPVANPDAFAVNEGGTVNGAVLGNDTDPDSTLTAVLVTAPAHAASFALQANGTFTYVHDGSETTNDAFTYKANDGSADSNIATVTITVNPVNDAPVANPDAFAVDEGGTVNGAVLSNDTDADSGTLTAALVTGPAHAASFTLNADGSFTYVHDGSEAATDSFTYRANDGSLDSNVATVMISIAPRNDLPVANADSYSVDEGATLNVAAPGVLSNDIDPDSTLTAVLVSGPAHASSFTLNANGSFTYVHDGSETTSDSFTYKANDGAADSNVVQVSISVTLVNDAPTAFSFSNLPAQAGIPITYPAGKLGGTDVEPGTTITIDTTPVNVVNGTVAINANGSFVFTPLPGAAGSTASFQYRVRDNGTPAPGVNSAYATVSFNVAGPAIFFTKSTPAGLANCTLGNECTIATAVANIGLASNAHIFIGDAGTQTLPPIALNSGGSVIGQGVQATTFDAFFGIAAPAQGTLAPRPAVNQVRPTVAATITLNTNSQVRGFNLTPSGDGLVASGKSGLAVSQMNITSDSNSTSTFCVNFANSSGSFLFGPIAVNTGRNGSGVNFNGTTSTTITFANVTMGGSGDAVILANSGATNFSFATVTSNSGRAVDISNGTGQYVFTAINANGASTGVLVQNATGLFVVNGVNGNAGTGGTIQNCALKGADFRGSRNITLRGMNFTSNATTDGPGANCGRIDLSTSNNGPLNCNANLSLQSVTNVTLVNLNVTGSQQIGIDGQSVSTIAMQGTTVSNNGNSADEDGVQMSNLSGTATLNVNDVVRDNGGNQFEIVNDAGNLSASFSTITFRNSTSAAGLRILGLGTAVINPFVGTSTFQNINAAPVKIDFAGAASGLINLGASGSGNTFTNNGLGIAIGATGTGAITYTIDSNTIGTNAAAAPASGCSAAGCDGIQVTHSGASGTHRVTIINNKIYHVGGAAVRVTSNGASTETARVRIANNVANFPDGVASSGIVVEDANAAPAGALMTCVDVSANQIAGLWAASTTHQSAIRIMASRALQFSLTNFNTATEYAAGAVAATCTTECTGAAGLDGNAADFLSTQNPVTVSAQASSGGSSASQQRLAASASWTGSTGACP